MARRKKVLITGAAGKIGTAIRTHLGGQYDFRLLLHSTVPDGLHDEDEVVMGDVSDFETMVKASKGVDATIHLAIRRWRGMSAQELVDATFDVDMRGAYNVYEAARINRVPKVVFASTNHVTGMYEELGIRSHPDMPVRPDSIYSAAKAFGEILGRLYSDRHGMQVLCLRVGSFTGGDPGMDYAPGYSRWQSPRDLAQMVKACLDREEIGFDVFYGVSRGAEEKWDLTNAKELLGYEPIDDGSSPEYRRRYARERLAANPAIRRWGRALARIARKGLIKVRLVSRRPMLSPHTNARGRS